MYLEQVKEDFNNMCDVLLLMLDVYFTIKLFLCMVFFPNVATKILTDLTWKALIIT